MGRWPQWKIVDTRVAEVPPSTAVRWLWLLLIWCGSVGTLALVGLLLRWVLKP